MYFVILVTKEFSYYYELCDFINLWTQPAILQGVGSIYFKNLRMVLHLVETWRFSLRQYALTKDSSSITLYALMTFLFNALDKKCIEHICSDFSFKSTYIYQIGARSWSLTKSLFLTSKSSQKILQWKNLSIKVGSWYTGHGIIFSRKC